MNFGQNNSIDASQQQALQFRMEKADVLQYPAKRFQEYQEIEQQLVKDVAWLPLKQQAMNELRKPCLQGFPHTSTNLIPPDDWANIYISNDQPCMNQTL
jgi:peptide/nickel transport system substrate-binding protein/oligopeptide transport system substrate-binding protein